MASKMIAAAKTKILNFPLFLCFMPHINGVLARDDDDAWSFRPSGAFLQAVSYPSSAVGRRLAWLVGIGGGACPSRGCQVDGAVQFVDPAPIPHGAKGGR